MDQPLNSENQTNDSLDFLFTNSRGDIIFVDQKMIRLLGDKSANLHAGAQLHSVFAMDSKSANHLLGAVKQESVVEKQALSYTTATGEAVLSDATAIAALDDNGNFLGMDLVLNSSPPAAEPETNFLTHADVVKAYVEMEMKSLDPLQPRTFTQSYLASQFNILQILLGRIGGSAAQHAFAKVADNTARLMGLPIIMNNGNLNFLKRDFDVQIYRSLLQACTDYAVNVVGTSIVKREMLLVDKFVGGGALELISQMDLRIFSNE